VLRNIEQTAPYFHDGSVTNLADVVRIMAQVQRDKELTNEEVNKIVAFLKTLTGEYKGKSVIKITKDDVN
jgi:cytochrome c peroxidase